MKPYFEKDGVTIYHGDCREILPTLPQADVLLTDPPYGLGDKWSGGTWATNPMYGDAKRWDHLVDNDTIAACLRKATVSIVWGGHYYALPPTRCCLTWRKPRSLPTMADVETAWTNLDRPSKLFSEDPRADGPKAHPTQKPVSLMRWCLGMATGRTVLDPFCGSGSTLRAALDLGRCAIGIEIEERYCEIAARRLDQGTLGLAFGDERH